MRHRDFALVQVGNGVSQLGTWGQYVALGWAIRQLAPSPFAVSLSLVAQFLPFLVLAPFGGALADRVNRRTVVVVGNIWPPCPRVALGLLVATGSQTIPLLLLLARGRGRNRAQPAGDERGRRRDRSHRRAPRGGGVGERDDQPHRVAGPHSPRS